jgi:hypothetical protein
MSYTQTHKKPETLTKTNGMSMVNKVEFYEVLNLD